MNPKLDEYKKFLRGKTAAVLGVGISNIPLIDFLLENGVQVTARDRKSIEKLAENKAFDMQRLEKAGVKFITGEGYLENITEQIIYKSPGIRYDKPEIVKAHQNGAFITSEMEAFLSLCPSKIIAVTGSNGKTTTTTLIAEILKNAGKTVHLGGNIGKPLLSQISSIKQEDFTVLELSSFQLHTVNRFENAGLPFARITFPDVGVITNISPNHLDWHTDMEEYALAKRAVFTHMKPGGKLVINRSSDEYVRRFASEALKSGVKTCLFGAYDPQCDGVSLDGDRITDGGKTVFCRSDIAIPGLHNVENYMAAYLATKDFVGPEEVIRTAKSFAGVPHRLELVAEKDGIRYYNGSIDSSPSRTIAALSCFGEEYTGRMNIILGGYDKHIPFEVLAEPICRKRCRAFITGATAEAIYKAISDSEYYESSGAMLIKCENFDAAVRAACAAALPGDVVLLSPACASFDEFNNFEQRGERFRALIKSIL